jgi:hypothetical protein
MGFAVVAQSVVSACTCWPGIRPGGRDTLFCVAKRRCPKKRRPMVPMRPERASPAVLSLVGVSLNSLRSNRREPSSAQPCAPRHGHEGTQVQGRDAACAPRALLGRAGSLWSGEITTESIAINAKQTYRNGHFECASASDLMWRQFA